MSTASRPFLDAYRHAEGPRHPVHHGATLVGAPVEASHELATSSIALGDSVESPAVREQAWTTSHDAFPAAECELPRVPRQGAKRPLSSFLHNFDQPSERPSIASPRQIAKWPPLSLELLAAAAPAYDKLLARLPQSTTQGSLIGVVGCGPSVGATTTAICLALRSATHGKSTLLVDADLARPSLAERLSLSAASPWIDSLRDGTSLQRAIVPGGEVAIDLLLNRPQGDPGLDPWARFHVGNAAGQMRRRYQRTLVDLGHDLAIASEVIAALAIDELILVCGPETTTEEQREVEQAVSSQGVYVSGILQAA